MYALTEMHVWTHGPCRYMNIVMKHLSMMHFLLFLFCFVRILSKARVCVCFLFLFVYSPHGMRICCSSSIDSFCNFYSHFLCVQKSNHLPMCHVFAPFTLEFCWIVFVLFTTNHFVSAILVGAHKTHTRFTLNFVIVMLLLHSSHSSVYLLLCVCSNVINVHRKLFFFHRLQTWHLSNFSVARVTLMCLF